MMIQPTAILFRVKPALQPASGTTQAAAPALRFHGKSPAAPGRLATAFRKAWSFLEQAQVVVGSIVLSWVPLRRLKASLEHKHLYSPVRGGSPDQLKSEAIKSRLKNEFFTSADGTRLNGWFVTADPEAKQRYGSRPVILFAHGRACNLTDCEGVIDLFTRRGFDIFTLDYRGYGNSEGIPSEQGLYEDLAAASRFLTQRYGIAPGNQVAVGSSLGGGVVAGVAASIPFKAAVITGSFSRMHDAITQRVRQFSPALESFLANNAALSKFQSTKHIRHCQSPLLVMGCEQDTMTPLWMSQALYEAAPPTHLKHFAILAGCQHHEAYDKGANQVLDELEQFLEKLG